ncbi:MAG: hypothetical protein CK548_03865 [Opitutia bacterium]|nr:MAG: hypothetical protein CK548_03865 [Opitutae bacterium]
MQKEKSRGELRIAGTYAGAGLLKILTADDTDGADEGFLIRVILKSVGGGMLGGVLVFVYDRTLLRCRLPCAGQRPEIRLAP